MGLPIPRMQPIVNLNAEIEELSQSLADGHMAMGSFNTAVQHWQDAYVGDPPGTYRNHVNGNWNIAPVDLQHPPVDMNPEVCHKFEANERGNCKNLAWCFRVFGTELKCQQTRKEEIPKPLKEHRRLEVD